MDNVTSYRLDPPQGGAQHALLPLSSVQKDTYIVDQVQHLSPEQAQSAKDSLRRLLRVAVGMHAQSRKRGGAWSDEFSPLAAKRCKVLGRSATDDAVDVA